MIRMNKQINNKIMILVNLRKNNQFLIKKIYNKMINVNKLNKQIKQINNKIMIILVKLRKNNQILIKKLKSHQITIKNNNNNNLLNNHKLFNKIR